MDEVRFAYVHCQVSVSNIFVLEFVLVLPQTPKYTA